MGFFDSSLQLSEAINTDTSTVSSMKKDHKHHEEKMVTVAIHTYERAHILKSFLESEGIPAVIHGIRMIEPVIPETYA